MSFSDSLKVALEALNANKLRAMLTMLGIIIGVGSVIALMAVGQGSQKAISDQILGLEADVLSPNALGAILNSDTIPALKVPIVAGGANNQLAKPEDGEALQTRGILYAPDYVINAGGIINVSTEFLGDGDAHLVRERIEAIPDRLETIWAESAVSGDDPAAVADAMAQRLIGRA